MGVCGVDGLSSSVNISTILHPKTLAKCSIVFKGGICFPLMILLTLVLCIPTSSANDALVIPFSHKSSLSLNIVLRVFANPKFKDGLYF